MLREFPRAQKKHTKDILGLEWLWALLFYAPQKSILLFHLLKDIMVPSGAHGDQSPRPFKTTFVALVNRGIGT